MDAEEAKSIFESNFSHIYYILYDTFVTAEANLRQRGTVSYLSYTVYFHIVGSLLCVTLSNKQTIHNLTKHRLYLSLHYYLKIQMKLINHSFMLEIAVLIITGDKSSGLAQPEFKIHFEIIIQLEMMMRFFIC